MRFVWWKQPGHGSSSISRVMVYSLTITGSGSAKQYQIEHDTGIGTPKRISPDTKSKGPQLRRSGITMFFLLRRHEVITSKPVKSFVKQPPLSDFYVVLQHRTSLRLVLDRWRLHVPSHCNRFLWLLVRQPSGIKGASAQWGSLRGLQADVGSRFY